MASFQLPVDRSDHERVVYQFEHGDTFIRATVSTWRTRLYVDLRVFWEPSPGEGLKPTKKGFRLPAESIDDLESAVAALKAAIEGVELSSSSWNESPGAAA